jgi:hypothetical protein
MKQKIHRVRSIRGICAGDAANDLTSIEAEVEDFSWTLRIKEEEIVIARSCEHIGNDQRIPAIIGYRAHGTMELTRTIT